MQQLNSTKVSTTSHRVNTSIQDSPARQEFNQKDIEKVYYFPIIMDE